MQCVCEHDRQGPIRLWQCWGGRRACQALFCTIQGGPLACPQTVITLFHYLGFVHLQSKGCHLFPSSCSLFFFMVVLTDRGPLQEGDEFFSLKLSPSERRSMSAWLTEPACLSDIKQTSRTVFVTNVSSLPILFHSLSFSLARPFNTPLHIKLWTKTLWF